MTLPRHPAHSDKVDAALMLVGSEEQSARLSLARAAKALQEVAAQLAAVASEPTSEPAVISTSRLAQATLDVERALGTLAMAKLSRAAIDMERSFQSDMASAALLAGPVASEEPVMKMKAAPAFVEGDIR